MSDNDAFRWEDPPLRTSHYRGVWCDRLAPLRERPGTWGRVHLAASKGAANVAVSRLERGRYVLPSGDFEFRSHGHSIYARLLEKDA